MEENRARKKEKERETEDSGTRPMTNELSPK